MTDEKKFLVGRTAQETLGKRKIYFANRELYSSSEVSSVIEEGMIIEGKLKNLSGGFPGGAVVKNPPANAGNTGSSPGPGRSHMPRSN